MFSRRCCICPLIPALALALLVRALSVAATPDLREGRMFGCPAVYVGRRMAACVLGSEVGLRLHAATATAREILKLREKGREMSLASPGGANYGQRLVDLLFERPIVNVRMVEQGLDCSFAKANSLVKSFVALGLLRDRVAGVLSVLHALVGRLVRLNQ